MASILGNASRQDVLNLALNVQNTQHKQDLLISGASSSGGAQVSSITLDSTSNNPILTDSNGNVTKLVVSGGGTESDIATLVLKYVYQSMPVGAPIPWPSDTAPDGWAKSDGFTFDPVRFPLLAKAYPSGKVLDLRGMFIRGLDTTGQFDRTQNRQVGSYEEGSFLCRAGDFAAVVNFNGYQSFDSMFWDRPDQARTMPNALGAYNPLSYGGGTFTPSTDPNSSVYLWKYIGVARPKNIAYNYIVRLA